MNRRGVSPVIATVLLVLIAIILAGIILVWAQSFVKEKAQKSGEPIENSCARIVFEAEAFASEQKIYLVNRGDVPIYGVEIRKKGLGSEIKVGLFDESTNTIANGESGQIDLAASGASITEGDDLIIVPIVLGESSGGTKAYTCDINEKSEEITVQA
jgi:flagellin-like protein